MRAIPDFSFITFLWVKCSGGIEPPLHLLLFNSYLLLRAGLIKGCWAATEVHEGITPLNTLRLRTLHEQGVEVAINTQDVVGVVLVVDPHKLTTVVNRIELQSRTGAGDDLCNTAGEHMWVVDEADLVGSSAVGRIHDSLVTSGGRAVGEERNTHKRAINEVVARSLTINQVNESTVGERSTEWLDKLINLRGEAEVLTDVSVLLLQVVARFRRADESVLRLTVNHGVMTFSGITGEVEVELIEDTLIQRIGRSHSGEGSASSAGGHRKRVRHIEDNFVTAEARELVAVAVAPEPLAVLFENFDFASKLLFSFPCSAEIVHAETGRTNSSLLEVVRTESASELNNLRGRVAVVASAVISSDIFPSGRTSVRNSRALLDERLDGLTHASRKSVLLDETVPRISCDELRGDHFSDTPGFLLKLIVYISDIVL